MARNQKGKIKKPAVTGNYMYQSLSVSNFISILQCFCPRRTVRGSLLGPRLTYSQGLSTGTKASLVPRPTHKSLGTRLGSRLTLRGSLLGPRLTLRGSLLGPRLTVRGSLLGPRLTVRGSLLGPRIWSGALYWDRGYGQGLSGSLAASPDELREVSLNILSFLLLSREAWRNLPTPAFSPPFSSFLCCRSSIILTVSLSSACTEQRGCGCQIAKGKGK